MEKYGTIYADPPWKLSGGKNGKGGWSKTASPDAHYPLMRLEEIASLPVQMLAAENSHLWLWVPNSMLPEGLTIMKQWGFRYINHICWIKPGRIGLGQYIRNTHELCLFGARGKIPYARTAAGKRVQIRSSFSSPRGHHSQKPAEVREMIQKISPGPYLELFARERAPGWDAWGNEVKSDIEMPGLWSAVDITV